MFRRSAREEHTSIKADHSLFERKHVKNASLLISPQAHNAHGESDRSQPGPGALHLALTVHLTLDTLPIDILFSLHDHKVLVLLGTCLRKAETGGVLDGSQSPGLQSQVAVEPEVKTIGGQCGEDADPNQIGVLSSRRGDAE